MVEKTGGNFSVINSCFCNCRQPSLEMLSEMKKKFAQHRIITQPFQLFFYNLTGFILDVIVVLFYRFVHTIVYFRVRKNRDYRNFFVTGHFGLHFFAVHYDLGVENLLLDAFTEKSLDAYKFNLLHNKQLFIRQLKQNRMGVRTIDEGSLDEGSGMNFSEYVAVLSGNTDLLEKARLEKKIAGLESERQNFIRSKSSSRHRFDGTLKEMEQLDGLIARIGKDLGDFENRVKLNEDGTLQKYSAFEKQKPKIR